MSMFTKEDGSQQVNIYQSHLVRAGSMSVMLKSDAMPSKYAKGNATHYCYMDVGDGSEKDYCLAVEHEVIEAINDAPKNEWLHMVATGAADQPATLKFSSASNPEPNPEPDIQPQGGPPPMYPEGDSHANGPGYQSPPAQPQTNNSVAKAAAMTVEAVGYLKDAGIPVDGDAAARIYNTHFIKVGK
jgi:hypothetical protein